MNFQINASTLPYESGFPFLIFLVAFSAKTMLLQTASKWSKRYLMKKKKRNEMRERIKIFLL